jgi:hypothetical protein
MIVAKLRSGKKNTKGANKTRAVLGIARGSRGDAKSAGSVSVTEATSSAETTSLSIARLQKIHTRDYNHPTLLGAIWVLRRN